MYPLCFGWVGGISNRLAALIHPLPWEAKGVWEWSKGFSGLVRIRTFLWEGHPDSGIVPENRSLHNTAVSSRRYFLSR